MKLIIILITLFFYSCSKSDNSGPSAVNSCGSKPLFTLWKQNTLENPVSLDFTNLNFGDNELVYSSNSVELCRFTLYFKGNECSGEYGYKNITQIVDINVYNCNEKIKDAHGTYTKSDKGLLLNNITNNKTFFYE